MQIAMKKFFLMMLALMAVVAVSAQVVGEDYDIDDYEEEDDDFAEYVDITVTTAAEFIDALGSNRTVRIAEGITINLSPVLNDPDFFVGKYNDWVSDMYDYEKEVGEYAIRIASDEVYDGRQLTLKNIADLTIIGGANSQLIVEPRYACVINLWRCSNIRFQNLVMGHTEEGTCSGAVIGAHYCYDTSIFNCDLYGCGTYGIEAMNCSVINMVSSLIRDCSDGIMWLIDCNNATFINCDFFDNAGGLTTYHTTNVWFNNCRFFRNSGLLFAVDRKIMLDGCEMWHSADSRGNVNVLSFEEVDYIWNDDNGESESRRQEVGPRDPGLGGIHEDGKGFDEYEYLGVYLSDMGKINQMYEELAPNFTHKSLDKYALIDLDNDGIPEICFRNSDNKHGAWFGQVASHPVILGLESQDIYADVILEGNWVVFRGYANNSPVTIAFQLLSSVAAHTLVSVSDQDGKETYVLDDKEIPKAEADKILHRGIKWNFSYWQPEWIDIPK